MKERESMNYPAELIRRARESRRQPHPPAQEESHPAAELREPQPAATWQARHGVYDQLMRSHDRVHTRHIGG